MQLTEFDRIDSDIARLEGSDVAQLDSSGKAFRPDGSPYQPTRQRDEAARLMDKYIIRLVRVPGGWAAVGKDGRAHVGPTSLIAICRVVVSSMCGSHATLR